MLQRVVAGLVGVLCSLGATVAVDEPPLLRAALQRRSFRSAAAPPHS
jgi:hypothetical protein